MRKFIAVCCMLFVVMLGVTSLTVFPVYAEEDKNVYDVKSAYLMDYDSKTVLFEQNATEQLPVASMVKLMTILLTFEEIDAGRLNFNDDVLTSENASSMGGSQVFIDPYVNYKVEDLLKSVIVASANDASVALAEKIAGSEEEFVKRMNKRAKELGMNNTNYVNCTGLPAPMQYSCAKDIATLDSYVIAHKEYFKYSTIWMEDLVHPSGRITGLVNTNKLIRYFKGCDCGKTGSTSEAGYCLTASAKRGNMRLIATVIGAKDSKSRFNETSKLLNFGFNNFENKQLVAAGTIITDIPVKKSETTSINLLASEDFYVVSKKGDQGAYEMSYEVPEQLIAPFKAGEQIGKLIITKNGQVIKEMPLISGENVEKLTFGQALQDVLESWSFWG